MRRRFHAVILCLVLLLSGQARAYDRIVSLKPNVTEILFALGLGGKVVGVTDYCKYPPEAAGLPKIGGYLNPNLERIFSLKPDLVVMIPDSTSPKVNDAIRRAGIETLIVRSSSLEEIYGAISDVAHKVGVATLGGKVVDGMKRRLKTLKDSIKDRPRRKGIAAVQRSPLVVASGMTFAGSLIEMAGVDNIARDAAIAYPKFSLDRILAERPEVIIDVDPAPEGDFWNRYASLPAVQNRAVHHLSPDLFIPGPRLPEALEILIRHLR